MLEKPYKGDENYIFISYAHKDIQEVQSFIEQLQFNGYNVWYDEGIDPGTEWDENIASHIRTCSYFIAYVTNNYVQSQNCRDELNYARDLDKERLIVYGEDVELPEGMKMRMNRLQAIFKYKYKNENDFYTKVFDTQGLDACRVGNIYEAHRIIASKEQVSNKKPLNTKIIIIICFALVLAISIFALVNNNISNNMPKQNNEESTSDNMSEQDNEESTTNITEKDKVLLSDSQVVYEDENYEITLSKVVQITDSIEFDYSIKNKSDKEVDFFIDEMVIDNNQIGVYSGNPLHAGSTMTQPVFINPSNIGEENIHTIKLYCSTSGETKGEFETEEFTCIYNF